MSENSEFIFEHSLEWLAHGSKTIRLTIKVLPTHFENVSESFASISGHFENILHLKQFFKNYYF